MTDRAAGIADARASTERTRALLVDDQHMIREALRILLETALGLDIVEAASGREAAAIAATEPLDLALVDVLMPEMDGVETLRRLRRAAPDLPVVMLSSYDETEDVRESLDEGARGYVLKAATTAQLREAIDTALSGDGIYVHPHVQEHLLRAGRAQTDLSERESVVLTHLAAGSTNEQIAEALSISRKTVKTHLTHVFRKLGVANRTEAVAKAIREGMVPTTGGRRSRLVKHPMS